MIYWIVLIVFWIIFLCGSIIIWKKRRFKMAMFGFGVVLLIIHFVYSFMPYNLAARELTKENLLAQIKIEIQKGKFKLDKKIPFIRLSGSNPMDPRSYNANNCGIICDNLVTGGFVDTFYIHEFSKPRGEDRSLEIVNSNLKIKKL